MLEWAPLVVVAETALADVLRWGIKIDAVIALPENEANLTLELMDQAPIKIFSAGDDLVEASFLFISGAGQRAVSILAASLPEALRKRIEGLAAKTQVTVKTSTQKWSYIASGQFKKWYQAGAIINFSNETITVDLNAINLPGRGFELTEDQWITIENSPPFWVSEEM
jgi:hypothetical protein